MQNIFADEVRAVRDFFRSINDINVNAKIKEEYVIYVEGDNYGTRKIIISKQRFDNNGEITNYEQKLLILPEFKILVAKIEGFGVQFKYRDPHHLIQLLSELIHYV